MEDESGSEGEEVLERLAQILILIAQNKEDEIKN